MYSTYVGGRNIGDFLNLPYLLEGPRLPSARQEPISMFHGDLVEGWDVCFQTSLRPSLPALTPPLFESGTLGAPIHEHMGISFQLSPSNPFT